MKPIYHKNLEVAFLTPQSVFDTYRYLCDLHAALQEYEVSDGGRDVYPEANGLLTSYFSAVFYSDLEKFEIDRNTEMLTPIGVAEIVTSAFPETVITTTTGTANDDRAVHHVSMRPGFLQDENIKEPLATGSAVNHDLAVAMMQAAVRMFIAIINQRAIELFYPVVAKTAPLELRSVPKITEELSRKGKMLRAAEAAVEALNGMGLGKYHIVRPKKKK